MSICIIGDSHVRRLKCTSPLPEMYLDEPESYKSVSGGTFAGRKSVIPWMDTLDLRKGSVVYMNVGSNDLANRACNPSQLACAMRLYARRYAETWGVQVVIGQLHKRIRQPHPYYNERVEEFNRTMKPEPEFWQVKGLYQPPAKYYKADGVHYNRKGYHKLSRGIRGAVMRAMVRLSGV